MDALIDREELFGRFEGALDVLEDTVRLFREDAPVLMERMRTAIGTGDAETLHRTAHSYKGMIANFSAPAAVEKAFLLQEMGSSGRLEGARKALDDLASLTAAVDRELDTIVGA